MSTLFLLASIRQFMHNESKISSGSLSLTSQALLVIFLLLQRFLKAILTKLQDEFLNHCYGDVSLHIAL